MFLEGKKDFVHKSTLYVSVKNRYDQIYTFIFGFWLICMFPAEDVELLSLRY